MARRRSESLLVTVYEGGALRRRPDELIVEEPMTIQLDGNIVSTTMRTPGHDYELAAGLCFGDGLLGGTQVTGVRYCADGAASESQFNVVTVETRGRAPIPIPRLGTTTSSCGLCGNEAIDALCDRLQPLPPTPPIALEL
jgi:FdhD protein